MVQALASAFGVASSGESAVHAQTRLTLPPSSELRQLLTDTRNAFESNRAALVTPDTRLPPVNPATRRRRC